jgi:hypothetical protein
MTETPAKPVAVNESTLRVSIPTVPPPLFPSNSANGNGDGDYNDDAGTDDDESDPEYTPESKRVAEYLKGLIERLKNKDGDLYKSVANGHFWVIPPEPSVLLRRALKKNQSVYTTKKERISPEDYYLPRVFIFLPSAAYPDVKITCPKLDCRTASTNHYHEEWKTRRVIGMFENYYVITKKMKCVKCSKKFMVNNSDVLNALPGDIQLVYKPVHSHRSAIDRDVLKLQLALTDFSVVFSQHAKLLKELHHEEYSRRVKSYMSAVVSLCSRKELGQLENFVQFPPFSSVDDKNGYDDHTPCGKRKSIFSS